MYERTRPPLHPGSTAARPQSGSLVLRTRPPQPRTGDPMHVDPTGRHRERWKERWMRPSAAAAAAALAALLLTMAMGFVPWASAGASEQADLAALRQATARFHDVGRALASGRVD